MNVYTQFYDIIADLIRWLEDNVKKDFYKKYRGLTQSASASVNQELAEQFPEFIQPQTGQALEILDDERWREDFFEHLVNFIHHCKNGQNKKPDKRYLLVRLIHKLDKGLSERVSAGTDYLNKSKPVNCLNTNWEQNGIMLLPRCRCLWERNSQGKQYRSGLMNDMKSMYYVKREDLGEYELKNVFLDKSFFQSRTNLRIGVSPITNEDVLKISYYEKEQSVYFSIDGLKNESDIRKKVGDIITKAKETDVDILLFPEMLGMEVLMEDYRKLFEEDWNGRYPKMIVFPSIWCNHTNTSVILGMDGNEIGRQQKQNKFFYEIEKQETQENGKIRKVAVKANEGLEPDKKILLFHIEGLGRVAVMICMDFLERDYRNMILDVLKGTFLLVPSFSTGYFDFTNAMQACCEYDCSVVWGNCCSAMNIGKMKRKNFEDIGYIQFSGKLTDSIGKISIEEGNRCSKKNCKKDCLFINDIPLNTQDKTNVEILF